MSNFKNFNKSTVSLNRNSMKCTAKLKVTNDFFNHKFELIFFHHLFQFVSISFFKFEVHIIFQIFQASSKRRKWSPREVKLVLDHFNEHVVGSTLPGKSECLKFLSKNSEIKNRTWTMIKDFIRNHKVSIDRKKSKIVKKTKEHNLK